MNRKPNAICAMEFARRFCALQVFPREQSERTLSLNLESQERNKVLVIHTTFNILFFTITWNRKILHRLVEEALPDLRLQFFREGETGNQSDRQISRSDFELGSGIAVLCHDFCMFCRMTVFWSLILKRSEIFIYPP